MTARPLTCTRCGAPCGIAEDMEVMADYGLAVVGEDGVVRPAEGLIGVHHEHATPLRARACCTNPECGHQWTLRRRFDPC